MPFFSNVETQVYTVYVRQSLSKLQGFLIYGREEKNSNSGEASGPGQSGISRFFLNTFILQIKHYQEARKALL